MSSKYIAVVLYETDTDAFKTLQAYVSIDEFLMEHGTGAESNEIDLMTIAVDGSLDYELGAFKFSHRPDQRLFYMIGSDLRKTQDTLRLAITDRQEHKQVLEKM